ncbi:MAG: PIN domain-containing protein [bacterium]
MKKKADVYLENSVISMFYQEEISPLMEVTREFWSIVLPKVNVFISDITIIEIRATQNLEFRKKLVSLISDFKVLPLTDDARKLARDYLRYRKLPEADALHIAIASLEGMDFLVTWNLRHLVKPGTQSIVRRINMDLGLPVPLIVTPEDFFEEV